MDWQAVKTQPSGESYVRKTVVTRQVIGTPTSADSSDQSFYQYVEDWWEMPPAAMSDPRPLSPAATVNMLQIKEPKTDYTYSRSASYSRKRYDEGYVSPNMSRRRLREDMDSLSVSMSPGKSGRTKHSTPSRKGDRSLTDHHSAERHSAERYSDDRRSAERRSAERRSAERRSTDRRSAERRSVSPGRSAYNYYAELSDNEEPSKRLLGVHGLRLPQSATRSGCKYGQNWAPSSNEQKRTRKRSRGRSKSGTEGDTGSEYSIELNDFDSYRSNIQMSFSGSDSVLKGRSLKHIYGLDDSEGEMSDGDGTEKSIRQKIIGQNRSTVFPLYRFFSPVFTTIMAMTHKAGSASVRAVTYILYMLYSLIVAWLGYLWQTVRWLCYDVWVGGAKYIRRLMTGRAYAADYRSSSNRTEDETTRTTTITTTTVTETVTKEDEFSDGELDGDVRWTKGGATVRSSHVGVSGSSWLTRMLKTLTVTATYMLLLPVTAAKGAVSGVASTTRWLVGDEDFECESAMTTRSHSVSENTYSYQDGSHNVKRRRSKPAQPVRDSASTHSVVVSSSEESILTRFAKTTTSVLRTVLWLPVGLCLGVGRMVTRAAYYETGHDHDEDMDTGVSVAYKGGAISTSETYTTSTVHRSWNQVLVETAGTVAWWPLATLLACCRWMWSTTCSAGNWFSGYILPTALIESTNNIHRNITKTIITDTWLLSRTGNLRRAYGCCCWLLPVLLIPLLITSAYYGFNRGFYRSALVPTTFTFLPIGTKEASQQAAGGALYTDEQLAAHVQTILIKLLRERETETQAILSEDWHAWADEFAADQSAAMMLHQKEVNDVIAALIKEQVGVLAAGLNSQTEQDAAKQWSLLSSQQDKIVTVQKQIKLISSQTDSLRAKLMQAKADMTSGDAIIRAAAATAVRRLEDRLDEQVTDLQGLHASHAALTGTVKACCWNESALNVIIRKEIEQHLSALLGNSGSGGLPLEGVQSGTTHPTFLNWLHQQFVGRDDMDSRLTALLAKIEEDIRMTSSEAQNAATLAASAAAAATAASKKMSEGPRATTILTEPVTRGGVTEKHVQMLIQQALLVYSADKTGKVDYALESAGGSVVSTRCSETYLRRTAQLSLFGIPLWYTSNSPRTIIQPDMQPGQCWAFAGSTGFLVIQLANRIFPTAFAMEHIPKSLSPTGRIDSAPKDFTVLGLRHDRDRDGVYLGNFTYNDMNEPLQNFIVTEPTLSSFSIVELQVNSNHGNKEYTCLYRFRVHGILDV